MYGQPYGMGQTLYSGMYQNQMPATQQQIIKVNGEPGARAYQMAPNSSALLLDESSPIVWLAQTDGAGYKTVTPYKIEPYQKEADPTFRMLEERITRLEGMINGKSNYTETE